MRCSPNNFFELKRYLYFRQSTGVIGKLKGKSESKKINWKIQKSKMSETNEL